MKIKNIWFTLIILLSLTTACNESLEDINTNPNAVKEIDDEYLFSTAVRQTFRGNGIRSLEFPFGTQYAHVYVGRNNAMFKDRFYDYFEADEYQYTFEGFYYGAIRHIAEVMQMTQPEGEAENEVRYAMAQIVAMMNFARLADAFGAVPYIEGGLGQLEILYPKYNSVEFIYTDMMERLKNIVLLLKNADPEMGYPGADPLYDNDLEHWVRFANSFRLRLAMRARFAAPELAEGVIVECLDQPLIETNDQNAWEENLDIDKGEFNNPIYGQYKYWLWRMSDFFVEKLRSTGDPRLETFVKPLKNGKYVGIPNGLSDQELAKWIWGNISEPTDILVGKAAPIYFMAAAEVWQLRAEAALFNIGPEAGMENQLYRKGIEMSMEQWTVGTDDINEYLANAPNANLSGDQEKQFEQISTHLWISFMSNNSEGWSNIRRTGYPVFPVRTEPEFSLGVTNGVLPTRLKYPISESNINEENYLKALEEQGPDEITTHLWWDVRN